jgi:antitoxin YefM
MTIPTSYCQADELDGHFETAHLLRSPANAERLLRALNRAIESTLQTTDLDDLE